MLLCADFDTIPENKEVPRLSEEITAHEALPFRFRDPRMREELQDLGGGVEGGWVGLLKAGVGAGGDVERPREGDEEEAEDDDGDARGWIRRS